MSGNYPPGVSDRTPDAPWNWPENDPEPFDAEIQQTLHKVVEVYTAQYIAEGDDEGYVDYDLSEVDWPNEYSNDGHYTPLELINMYKKELETKLELTESKAEQRKYKHLIEECSNWEEVETDIYG